MPPQGELARADSVPVAGRIGLFLLSSPEPKPGMDVAPSAALQPLQPISRYGPDS